MVRNSFTFILAFSLASGICLSQERKTFIALEVGVESLEARGRDQSYLRADWYSEYGIGFSYAVNSNMARPYASAKFEVRNRKDMLGFVTGIRYSSVQSELIKTTNPDFFFVRIKEEDQTTLYAKVTTLSQQSSYIGIPLELRIFTMKPRFARLYFLIGSEVSFRVRTVNRVAFKTQDMVMYEGAVSDLMGKPNNVMTSFYGKAGLTFGKEKPLFSFGFTFPALISNGSSTLVSPVFGGGIHCYVQKKI